MSESILVNIKKLLGLPAEYTVFDVDVITFINSAFSTLNQLGIGPSEGFMIVDDTTTWEEYLENDPRLNAVKSYVFIRVKLVFDPPTTSYFISALNEQRLELEWRLNVGRENEMMPHVQPLV